mgnify:FL=1
MENRTDPITAQQKRFRRRRLKKGCTAGLLALLLLGGAIGGYFYIKEKNGQETGSGSTVAYRVQQVTRGSVQTSLSASGTLSAIDTQTLTAAYGATVTEVLAAAGDTVETGQLLVALEPEEEGELVTLLEENKQSLAKTQRLSNQLYLRNGASGTVKDLKLEAGSDAAAVMEQYGYVCLLSTDDLMQLDVQAEALSLYDTVRVETEAGTVQGVVRQVCNGTANILIDDISLPVGAQAQVYDGQGTLVGAGTLALVNYQQVTAVDGVVASLSVRDGSSVGRNSIIATFTDYPTSSAYAQLLEERQELLEEYEEAFSIRAEAAGRVLELSAEPGDTLGTLMTDGGYTVSLSLDEEDILSVTPGMEVSIEPDAVEGSYTGSIKTLSYVNTGSGSARYKAVVEVPAIEGVLPGMSVECTVVISDSGEGLLVPVEAIQRINGKDGVYLAPEGSAFGSSFGAEELDLSALEWVEVQIAASDDSQVLVTGELEEGQKILTKQVTTSSTYTPSETQDLFNSFQMPGGGGSMPDMGGFGGNMPGSFGGSGDSGFDKSQRRNKMIDLSHICKTYVMGEETIKAMDDVSLHIYPQEYVSVVGPSGSGKSTLMHILGCLDRADAGRYLLEGQDVTLCSPGELSRIRSRRPSSPAIYTASRVSRALEKVGLGSRMGHRPDQLSGGQQQRAAIARALVTEPALILADEPTGNLDSHSGEEIMHILDELHDRRHTLVVITHSG